MRLICIKNKWHKIFYFKHEGFSFKTIEQSSAFSRYNYYDKRPNLELYIEINLSPAVSLPLPFLFAALASSFGSSHFECGVWAFSGSFRRLRLGLQQHVAGKRKKTGWCFPIRTRATLWLSYSRDVMGIEAMRWTPRFCDQH